MPRDSFAQDTIGCLIQTEYWNTFAEKSGSIFKAATDHLPPITHLSGVEAGPIVVKFP